MAFTPATQAHLRARSAGTFNNVAWEVNIAILAELTEAAKADPKNRIINNAAFELRKSLQQTARASANLTALGKQAQRLLGE